MKIKVETLDQINDSIVNSVEPQIKNKYILLGNGTIQVWQNDQLIYEGVDWNAAQLSIVPF